MKYLKVFTNFSEDLELLSDVEVGRLFRAMLAYAEAGTSGELKGNERFLWATVKKNIDNQREKYEERCSINKAIATNRYESLRLVTKKHDSCEEKEKDKEKEKEKEIKKKDASASGAIRYDQYRSAFIEECPSLPKPSEAGKWTAARKQAIRAKGMTPEEMRTVFAKVQRSDFLSGRSGRWSGCSLDWILKPANWQKIREGNYDNKGSQRTRSAPTYDLGALDEMDLTKL